MAGDVTYSERERFWLWVLAVVGFLPLNGAFFYGLLQPDVLLGAVTNPIALAFILESTVLVGVWAYLLGKWRVRRVSWPWFVFLSLLGGIAFAVPVALLWRSASGGARRAVPAGDRPDS